MGVIKAAMQGSLKHSSIRHNSNNSSTMLIHSMDQDAKDLILDYVDQFQCV
jgi:hypothetical protein